MRKFSLVLAACFCLATVTRANDQVNTPSDPNTTVNNSDSPQASGEVGTAEADAHKQQVQFDGETFLFAWDGASPNVKIREFLPAGQTIDHWTKFAALNEYPLIDNPHLFAQAMVEALKKQNPQAGSQLQENEKTGEVMFDFVTWPDDKSYVEFNVFKFRKLPAGGIVGEQYAQRAYTVEDQKALLDNLGELKKRVLPLMAEKGLQLSNQQ